MKKIGSLFCAVALASALPLLRAQNAPVPAGTMQGAASLTVQSTGATTVVLVPGPAAGPVALPPPAGAAPGRWT